MTDPPDSVVFKNILGRKEIVMFFYLYMLVTIFDLLLISGIIPTASDLYPVRSSKWIGFMAKRMDEIPLLTFLHFCSQPL